MSVGSSKRDVDAAARSQAGILPQPVICGAGVAGRLRREGAAANCCTTSPRPAHLGRRTLFCPRRVRRHIARPVVPWLKMDPEGSPSATQGSLSMFERRFSVLSKGNSRRHVRTSYSYFSPPDGARIHPPSSHWLCCSTVEQHHARMLCDGLLTL